MTFDPSKYGPSPSLERHRDGPDMFRVRTEPRVNDRRHAPGTAQEIGFGFGHDSELYRMRTQPHLYDERDLDAHLDLMRTRARRLGAMLADCHTCKVTTMVTEHSATCHQCHREV